MLFHKYNETENEATYLCKHRKHPSFACKAKLKVVKEESSERWIISTPHEYIKHSCDPNEAEIIAKLLKENMKDIVRKYPATAVARAMTTVLEEAEDTESPLAQKEVSRMWQRVQQPVKNNSVQRMR